MANVKLSQISSGGSVNAATDQCVTVRSGTTDVLTTPVSLGATQTWTGPQTFVAPILGAATATSVNKVAITAPATSATLTIANGATLTCSATATVSGTNTGDQTITLTGNVTGSGTGSFATTIAAGVVTNAMLAGSIAASNLVGTDIATVGTITTGTWNGTTIAIANGGTGQTTAANAINALLPSQTGQSGNFLTTNGTVASWAAGGGGGSGTVTSIIAGSGLSGGTITTTGTISLNVANANTWTAIQTVTPSGGSANTNADAVILGTLGAASATGTQFDSGSLRFTCSAWKSNATAGAQLNDWIMYALPVTGTSVSTSILRFDCQNQATGGGYFQTFGIVSGASGQGSVFVGSDLATGSQGAIWVGSTVLTTAAIPVIVGGTANTIISNPASTGALILRNNNVTVISLQNSGTIASGASVTWNSISVPAITLTLTGTTAITTAGGFNLATINAPVITGTAVAITNAATLAITGAPTFTGSVTNTNAYAFWVQSGTTRLASNVILGANLNLGNAATTGLTPGVLSATTNATIVISDSTGQAYRIPCII